MITIQNEEAAKAISTALKDAFNSIGRSLEIAKTACTEAEMKTYSDHVGDLFYTITFKLLEPIYFQYPNLKPADWGDEVPMDPS